MKDEVWTEARIAQLRVWWDEEVPAAEIGRRMGLTKSAVVGKAHRLELQGRVSPIKRLAPGAAYARPISPRVAVRRAVAAHLPRSAAASVEPLEPAEPPTVFLGRRSEPCCWITGDAPRRGVAPPTCDAPSLPGRSYCLAHQARSRPVSRAASGEGPAVKPPPPRGAGRFSPDFYGSGR